MSLGLCSTGIDSADMREGHVDTQIIYRVTTPLPGLWRAVATYALTSSNLTSDPETCSHRLHMGSKEAQSERDVPADFMPSVHVRCLRRSCLLNDKHLETIPEKTRPSQGGQIASDMSCKLRRDFARQAPAAQSTAIQQAHSTHRASGSCSIM
jgi:hypothetical protein